MFSKKYDVFLAYHGTHENDGLMEVCNKIYNFLIENGIKTFFFPQSAGDNYRINIAKVMQSRTFLLVCNNKIHLTENLQLDSMRHYELSMELNTFYAVARESGERALEDAKVFAVGDCRDPKLKESQIHELFSGRTYIYYNPQTDNFEVKLDELLNWVNSRLGNKWHRKQISTEIYKSYMKRAVMSQDIDLPNLITHSKKVRIAGVSNIEITFYNKSALQDAIKNGAEIEVLFLEPTSSFAAQREQEDYGEICGITKGLIHFCIKDCQVLKTELGEQVKNNFRLYKYDCLPRFNLILLDTCAVLQFYPGCLPGDKSPCFYIKREDDSSPVYDFCTLIYNNLKLSATEIE